MFDDTILSLEETLLGDAEDVIYEKVNIKNKIITTLRKKLPDLKKDRWFEEYKNDNQSK